MSYKKCSQSLFFSTISATDFVFQTSTLQTNEKKFSTINMTKFQESREFCIMCFALVRYLTIFFHIKRSCYVTTYNIFTTNFRRQVITNFNLNLQLKLLFYSLITIYYIILLCNSVHMHIYN